MDKLMMIVTLGGCLAGFAITCNIVFGMLVVLTIYYWRSAKK